MNPVTAEKGTAEYIAFVQRKKEQKAQEEERELAFRAEIDTLKNKLDLQEEKAAA